MLEILNRQNEFSCFSTKQTPELIIIIILLLFFALDTVEQIIPCHQRGDISPLITIWCRERKQ